VPLTEESALRTTLQTYPTDSVRMLQQIFGWLDDEYDKIPVEREILGDRELPGTVLRLPMVYGPGDRLRRFLPIVKRVDDGRRAEGRLCRGEGCRGARPGGARPPTPGPGLREPQRTSEPPGVFTTSPKPRATASWNGRAESRLR